MHEEVRSNLHNRLFGSLRLPSLAGRGLPERMRTTAFAFLGLTAAAGLALVAVFAQLSFPLLSPAPLPSEPVEENAVAEAVGIERHPQAVALPQGAGGAVASRRPANQAKGGRPAPVGAGEDAVGGVETPSPVSTPPADEEGVTSEPPPASSPPSSSTPTETPTPAVQPDPVPASGGSSGPKARPARSKPDQPVAKPAKSKPGKAKPKPVAKSESKPAVPEAKPKPEPVAPPPPPPDPDPEGKEKGSQGKAPGHGK